MIQAELVTQLTSVKSQSFFDLDTFRHLIDVVYCGKITNDAGTVSTKATLSFTYKERHTKNSPMTVNMIPGPCKFSSPLRI